METKESNQDQDPAEIIPKLFYGSYSVARNLKKMQDLKISHVLNLGVELDNCFEGKLKMYKKVGIRDLPGEDVESILDECHRFIDSVVVKGEGSGVFVHCHAGVSRSGSVILSYMQTQVNPSTKKKYTLKESWDYVRSKRKKCSPNLGFIKQLMSREVNTRELERSTIDFTEYAILWCHEHYGSFAPHLTLEKVRGIVEKNLDPVTGTLTDRAYNKCLNEFFK